MYIPKCKYDTINQIRTYFLGIYPEGKNWWEEKSETQSQAPDN